MKNTDLARLLKSAAEATDPVPPAEMPFGFDTRVMALWQSKANGTVLGLTRLLRRVTLLSAAVIVLGTAGVYLELNQGQDSNDEYALADAAIQDELGQ